ncbi:SpoIID/LytB domain-containing protein [Sutcliffiella halmapala]
MMKKLLLIPLLALALVFQPINADAATKTTYTEEVKVSVYRSTSPNVSITLKGMYAVDSSYLSKRFIEHNTTLSITRNGSNLSVGFGRESATSGYDIPVNEYQGSLITAASGMVNIRDIPTTTEESKVITTMDNREAAEYLGESKNTNDVHSPWYKVNVKGITGWIASSVSNGPTTYPQSLGRNFSTFQVDGKEYRGSFIIKKYGSNGIEIVNVLGIEDYIKGVVPNESYPSWHMEALKAQSVTARSYAYASGILSNTTSSQVYNGFSSEHSRTNEAVEATKGEVVKYQGKPIMTFFGAASGGVTANYGDVWSSGGHKPYYASVPDPYEAQAIAEAGAMVQRAHKWTFNYSANELLSEYTLVTKQPFSPTVSLLDMEITKTGANGEVSSVTYKTTDGTFTRTGNEGQIRAIFPSEPAFYNMLPSSMFNVSYTKDYTVKLADQDVDAFSVYNQKIQLPNGTQSITGTDVNILSSSGTVSHPSAPKTITVSGGGWGHRIGMSQWGAQGFAKFGNKNYKEILVHYYPGTEVSSQY